MFIFIGKDYSLQKTWANVLQSGSQWKDTEMTAGQLEHRNANVQTSSFVINCLTKLIITINWPPSHSGPFQNNHNVTYGTALFDGVLKRALCHSRHVKFVAATRYQNKQKDIHTTK
jgi:hypothetical protein